MITLDLNVAIAVFLSFCLILVFGKWIFYNPNQQGAEKDPWTHTVQCPYCMHLFDETRSGLIRCPNCRSIIDVTHDDPQKK